MCVRKGKDTDDRDPSRMMKRRLKRHKMAGGLEGVYGVIKINCVYVSVLRK